MNSISHKYRACFPVVILTGAVPNQEEALLWYLEAAFKGFQLCLQSETSTWSDNVDNFCASKLFRGKVILATQSAFLSAT